MLDRTNFIWEIKKCCDYLEDAEVDFQETGNGMQLDYMLACCDDIKKFVKTLEREIKQEQQQSNKKDIC